MRKKEKKTDKKTRRKEEKKSTEIINQNVRNKTMTTFVYINRPQYFYV